MGSLTEQFNTSRPFPLQMFFFGGGQDGGELVWKERGLDLYRSYGYGSTIMASPKNNLFVSRYL